MNINVGICIHITTLQHTVECRSEKLLIVGLANDDDFAMHTTPAMTVCYQHLQSLVWLY